jgi:hypothetical protein
MAETEIKETEVVETPQETEGVKVEETSEETKTELADTENMPDSSGNQPDDGPSKVKQWMEKLGIGKTKDEPEAEEESEEPEADEEQEVEEDVPDEFTDWARSQGWSDTDIVDFASELSNTDLLDAMKSLDPSLAPEQPKEVATPETPAPVKTEGDKDTAKLRDEIRDELREEFQKEMDRRIGKVEKETEVREQERLVSAISKAFDESGFDVFGKTDDLLRWNAGPHKGEIVMTSPEMKARREVVKTADAFMALGANIEEAMAEALVWYKGKNLEKDVHRKLVRDLKTSEKKLSAKRSGKELVPTFEDEEERQADFIRRQAEKLGIKLPEEDV